MNNPIIHISGESVLAPVIESWGIYLQDQGKSPHTVKAFLADLRLFAGFFPPNQTIAAITTENINSFLGWLESGRGVSCSPKSLARRVTSIKAFFRWLFQNGRITSDPAEKVLQKTVISPLPEVLTPEEIEKVRFVADTARMGKIPDSRPAALFGLLIETGIKKGECLALSMNHIDTMDDMHPYVFVRYANPANRYKERKIESQSGLPWRFSRSIAPSINLPTRSSPGPSAGWNTFWRISGWKLDYKNTSLLICAAGVPPSRIGEMTSNPKRSAKKWVSLKFNGARSV